MTPFATQGGGVDKVVDSANITEFSYKGVTFTVNTANALPADGNSGTLSWTYGSETDIDGNIIYKATVTDSSDGSTLIFGSNGYYNYTPDQTNAPVSVDEIFTDGSVDNDITASTTDNGNPTITYTEIRD